MTCPPAETLAAFAEGKLDRRQIAEILAHVEHCQTCMTALELINDEVNETATPLPQPQRAQQWWLLAAAVIAAVAITSLLLVRPWRSPIDKLVAAAPRSARVVEPRLAGGFPWATYRGPLRANEAQSDPDRLRLAGVAADAVERGRNDASPGAQHAAGVALVLIDDPAAAVEHLRAAANRSPNDPKAWSDLAAAEYQAAVHLGRPAFYPDALGHADHALRLDPNLAEALFNRALTLERMHLVDEARAAWSRYLEVDGSSAWANEAREHLAHLPATNGEASFAIDQPRLEAAAAAGDARTVAALVDRHRERARAFGEVEYLGRWADAVQRGNAADAARWLAVARVIGDALQRLSGESLLHDAVAAIDARGSALAEAQLAYRRGRLAQAQQKPTEAEPELRRAGAAESPISLMARIYAATTRIDRQDVAGAHAELDALVRELRAHPRYVAAMAYAQWDLAVCRRAEGDWPGVAAALREAAADFTRLGETSDLAAIESLHAFALDALGRPEEAWAARIHGFELESAARRGERLARALAAATDGLARAQKHDAARALLAIEERAERAMHSDGMLVYALLREAQLAAASDDEPSAQNAAREAMAVALRLPDPKLRAREIAAAKLAAGAAELPRNPKHAYALLSDSLAGFTTAVLRPRIADAALLRARAALRLGDANGAAHDLDTGIAALDRLHVPLAGGAAPGVFDTGAALFEEAVRLHLDRGDVAGAFAYAERSRAQIGGSGGEDAAGPAGETPARRVQQKLAGSGTVVLESFVINNEAITFAIGEREVVVGRASLPSASDDASLYDALIRPVEPAIAHAQRIIIVPDSRLAGIPYAALSNGTQPLVERLPVALAPSASALVRAPRDGVRSVAAMALPANGAPALPESESEVADVAHLYPRGAVVAATLASLRDAHADVLHIAGHTSRDAADDDAVTFAGDERAAWSTIAATPLHAGIVTLSACETLRDPAHAGGRALSLGAGFLAAGAHDVVGTLVPIADRDARALFRNVHRQLAAGAAPSEAVQRAQLDDLRAGGTAWRALAVLTDRIEE